MHLAVTVTEDTISKGIGCRVFIASSNRSEEFRHQNLAVFTCHEFFIGVVFFQDFKGAFAEWASIPDLAFMPF